MTKCYQLKIPCFLKLRNAGRIIFVSWNVLVIILFGRSAIQPACLFDVYLFVINHFSRGTKVEKVLTLAPERYTAGFRMVAKVILWCI